jgi:MraZ protein
VVDLNLIGTFDTTLDDKNRIVIPAQLRDRYQGELVLKHGSASCIWIMTIPSYEKFLERLKKDGANLEQRVQEALLYHHKYSARTAEVDPKTGRIPIASSLRAYGKFNKDMLILYVDDSGKDEEHLEIWDTDTYQKFMNENQMIAREYSNSLGEVKFFTQEKEI